MAFTYQHLIPELRSKKVGLVLCGGGFKGAYQIGVWKALRDPRIGLSRFKVISGTSVGALNALLIANGDIQDAEKVWGQEGLLKVSAEALGDYFLGYTLIFGPIVAMSLTLGVALSVLRATNDSLLFGWRFLPEFFLAAFFLVAALSLLLHESQRPQWLNWVILPTLLAVTLIGESVVHRQLLALLSSKPAVPALAAAFCAGFTLGIIDGLKYETFFFVDERIFVIGALAFVAVSVVPVLAFYQRAKYILALWFLLVVMSYLFGNRLGQVAANVLAHAHEHAHLLSNAGLLKIIHAKLLAPKIGLAPTVFATLAEKRLVAYPFAASYTSSEGDPRMMHYDTHNPDSHVGWYPEYINLSKLDTMEKVLEVLRLTSAIPFFLESGTSKNGHRVVDGGVVDNMPIVPVWQSGVDYVIVVSLSPRDVKEEQVTKVYNDHLRESWKQWFLSTISYEDAQQIYQLWFNQWRMTGSSEFWHLLPESPAIQGDHIVSIGPERALASIDWFGLRFVTGTLNLSLRARLKWMQKGFDDTMNAFGISQAIAVQNPSSGIRQKS